MSHAETSRAHPPEPPDHRTPGGGDASGEPLPPAAGRGQVQLGAGHLCPLPSSGDRTGHVVRSQYEKNSALHT